MAQDKIENDLDDGRVRPRRSSSPDSLPVIIDKGPYKGYFYPKDQLYFNSIMLAADVEPRYVGPPGGEFRQEVARTPIRRPRGRNNRSPSPRPVPSEWLTASQNAENLRRWEERNGVEPRPMRARRPSRMLSPPRPTSPPRGPIMPGTQEWDKFMDFPSETSYHPQSDKQCNQAAKASVTLETPGSSVPAVTEMQNPLPSHRVNNLPQRGRSIPPSPTSSQIRLPGISPTDEGSTQPATWTSALNSILHNEAVDPAMREAVIDRARHNSATRGSEHHETLPIAPVDAGLVPNFSYPVAASAFYDRVDAAQESQIRPVQEDELLPNGVSVETSSHTSSNDTLYRDPTPLSWPLRGGQEETHSPLTNGVPPGYYPPSSSDGTAGTADTSIDPRQRPPPPPDLVPEHTSTLLSSILTPSEFALHREIVHGAALVGTPISPTRSNTSSSTPLDTRLIQKLDTVVYGLQDRINGLEDDLVPQLGTWLEQKDLEISELHIETSNLRDEVAELKRIVDFSSRTLGLCREREWEVWQTLLDIQRKREEKRSPLSRVFSWVRGNPTRDVDGLQSCRSTDLGNKGLLKKELDALLLIAKQNVDVIDEDMEEMARLVWACKAKNDVTEEVRPVEGSGEHV